MGSYVDELIKKARKAQKVYADFSQAEYDKITRICAKTVYEIMRKCLQKKQWKKRVWELWSPKSVNRGT